MPKKLLAIIAIVFLGITSLSTESFVTANFIPTQPEIKINTPMQTELKIYQNISVPLLVDIKENSNFLHAPSLPRNKSHILQNRWARS